MIPQLSDKVLAAWNATVQAFIPEASEILFIWNKKGRLHSVGLVAQPPDGSDVDPFREVVLVEVTRWVAMRKLGDLVHKPTSVFVYGKGDDVHFCSWAVSSGISYDPVRGPGGSGAYMAIPKREFAKVEKKVEKQK